MGRFISKTKYQKQNDVSCVPNITTTCASFGTKNQVIIERSDHPYFKIQDISYHKHSSVMPADINKPTIIKNNKTKLNKKKKKNFRTTEKKLIIFILIILITIFIICYKNQIIYYIKKN